MYSARERSGSARPSARHFDRTRGQAGPDGGDGRALRLVFREGAHHHNQVLEWGLLFVEPRTASDRERWMTDKTAVEDLGDGWYVFEE